MGQAFYIRVRGGLGLYSVNYFNIYICGQLKITAVIKTAHLPFITVHFTSFNTAHIYFIVKKGNLKGR
jgi:hypothetical protein